MQHELMTPIGAALDESRDTVRLFLRDDDAGWDDERLFALLACVERVALPIDLAAIPKAVTPALARELCARHDAAPARLGLHQHGFEHVNHDRDGKCEFGAARSAERQDQDIRAGRALLIGHFEHRLDAIFTPPWNRCAETTPPLLARLGFAALSRDHGAPPQDALSEIAVDLDWCKVRKRSSHAPQALVQALAAAICRSNRSARPVGLMLHHAQMDDIDLALLATVLGEIALHPRACFCPMRALLRVPECAHATAAARQAA